MSPVGTVVATSERRFREFSWNQKKIAVTLHRQSEQTTSERQVKTSIKRVKSRMLFELFRAKEVSSEAQKTVSLTI